MKTVVKQLKPHEIDNLLDRMKVTMRTDAQTLQALKNTGWDILDYAIEKQCQGIWICIEFCLGDFCVYPASKHGKWVLEDKQRYDTFIQALVAGYKLMVDIEDGRHWPGEDD